MDAECDSCDEELSISGDDMYEYSLSPDRLGIGLEVVNKGAVKPVDI
jgi:hypothetical protein